MTDVVARSMMELSFTVVVLGVAAAITLAVGAVGLSGAIAFIVGMRMREVSPADPIALGGTVAVLSALRRWRAGFPRAERRESIRRTRCGPIDDDASEKTSVVRIARAALRPLSDRTRTRDDPR